MHNGVESVFCLFTNMIFLNDQELEQLLPPHRLVEVIEEAMRSDEQKVNLVPQRMHVSEGSNTFLLMPAYGQKVFGTKLVSVIPKNSEKGLPVIHGLYSLNDSETGAVLALMSASKLTALRTGAIAAAALRALTGAQTETMGIIGPGVQAVWIAICSAAIRPIKKIFVVGRSPQSLKNFTEKIRHWLPSVQIVVLSNAEQLLQQTETIVTATTSDLPVLPDNPELLASKTFIAMGSYQKHMRELPDSAFRLSGQILIDAPGIRTEVGDILYPIDKNFVRSDQVHTLGSVLCGTQTVRSDTKVFKSAGYALFDLFAAQALYASAHQKGAGCQLSF